MFKSIALYEVGLNYNHNDSNSFLWFQECFSKFLIDFQCILFKNENVEKIKMLKTFLRP